MSEYSFSAPLRPFYQGQLDFFCAIYAVLNALKISYEINNQDALFLFKETLKDISKEETYWQATLNNHTDFHWLPLWLLYQSSDRYPIRVEQPFTVKGIEKWAFHKKNKTQKFLSETKDIQTEKLITHLPLFLPEACLIKKDRSQMLAQKIEEWLASGMCRSVILRFHRHLPFSDKALVSHWTTGYYMVGNELRLLDASKEKNAIHSIPLDNICTRIKDISKDKLIRIEPESVYLIEPL
ncbi:hypothetical protein [Desulfovibrio litoralis]|uniref:Uncharacterized protein n=1 Tax=Desulfovibrio litoralis DSM 11393 TaxID=1121455 RepID=A0A1M7S926_9BACT|nr:hypothetical protein [Desulfovibrio litoralis]SHN54950.1 hypothetical protein SAMN02745728_00609 [Desulfovibrio litoralis DSM 11393]